MAKILIYGTDEHVTRKLTHVFTKEGFERDFYLAIPLQKGQLSCREVMNGEKLAKSIKADEKLMIDHVDGPYSRNPSLKELILNRGL